MHTCEITQSGKVDTAGSSFFNLERKNEPKMTRETQNILTLLLLKYSPTKWPINTIYIVASSDAC